MYCSFTIIIEQPNIKLFGFTHESSYVRANPPPADAHEPGVDGLEDIFFRMIRSGLEPVAVKHLNLTSMPS